MNLPCRTLTKASAKQGITWICCKRYHFHRSPHKVLKIKEGASKEEIKSAFLELSKQYHPDKNKNDPKAHEKFVELNNAYQALMEAQSGGKKDGKRTGSSYTQNWDPSTAKWEFDREAYERRKKQEKYYYEREKFENQKDLGQQVFQSINLSFMVFAISVTVWMYIDYAINRHKKREAAEKRRLERERLRGLEEALSELRKMNKEIRRKAKEEKLRKAKKRKEKETSIENIIFNNRKTNTVE